MEEALIARLRATTAITSLLATVPLGAGTRAAIDVFERAADVFPYIVIHGIAPGRKYHHGGARNLSEPVVQMDIWATTPLKAIAVERVLIAEMETAETIGGIKFDPAFVSAARDSGPEDLADKKIFGRQVDFDMWWAAA